MAIGIVFLVTVVFVIPGAAILGAVYLNFLMETRSPPGRRVRAAAREPSPVEAELAVAEPVA